MQLLAVALGAVSIWLGTVLGWNLLTGHRIKGLWPKVSLAWIVALAIVRATPWSGEFSVIMDCCIVMWLVSVLGGGQLGWLHARRRRKKEVEE